MGELGNWTMGGARGVGCGMVSKAVGTLVDVS